MNPKNIAGTVAAGAGAAAVMITAEQVKGWVDVASTVVSSPASTLIFMLLVLMMVGWLAYRLYYRNEACEERINQMMDAMRILHTMLASDERYADQMPAWEDFIKPDSIDVRALRKMR
ncbi:MAG: hypothetical protein M0P19_13910 [Nevskia sp.]|jgi:hypothetical protein|nr:hypothetical protein [Nevskia sp.]MCK9385876.1 hypothetical protein [Nevskia sp.]